MDTYTRVIGKTVEELREEARPTAEQRVRSDLVLDAVAEQEGVEVPAEEIDAQVRLVAGNPTLGNKERRRLLASDDLRGRIIRRLRRRYTINRLLEVTNPPETKTVSDDADEPAASATTVDAVAEETAPVAVSSEPAAVAGAKDSSSDQQNEQEN
jgi:FKBP-type peptidyl-prolyl cis-trans isomerase (trigger factor)